MKTQSSAPELACSLSDAELRERRTFVRQSVTPHILQVQRDALRLQIEFNQHLPRSVLEEFVQFESQCCGFLEFTILETDARLQLRIVAPPEASAVLEMFAENAQPC